MTDTSRDTAPTPPGPQRDRWYLARLWFGVTEPVRQRQYIASGFGLMLFKYCVEAVVIWNCTFTFFSPLDFLNPSTASRQVIFASRMEWLPMALILWTLPFLWISVSMSVRRAADAGNSPWLGLMVLIPIINLIVMLTLCFLPSQPEEARIEAARSRSARARPGDAGRAKDAALAIALSVVVGGLMLLLSVYVLSSYGASFFLGAPMLMSTTASYLYNRKHPRSVGTSLLVGLGAVLFAMCALLLFALEGAICLVLAVPLLLPIGAMGGLVGKGIAEATRRPQIEIAAAVLVLSLWTGADALVVNSPEYVVVSSVEIAAPPDAVWKNVVDFPEITAPKAWYFALGIACPERARIVGQGVGATRYCEFTTGAFVEPITAWEEPRRLAFDVTKQPDPMWELSPYRNVHPPHLDHTLRSTRGEFQLIALPDGRTRLEGRTWYKFDMFPAWYLTAWSDFFIHRIHERVLVHIKERSEGERGPQPTAAVTSESAVR